MRSGSQVNRICRASLKKLCHTYWQEQERRPRAPARTDHIQKDVPEAQK